MTPEDIGEPDDLLLRLCTAAQRRKRVVFLVGVPVSAPSVPDVAGIIELIRARLLPAGRERLDSEKSGAPLSQQYQRAFQILHQTASGEDVQCVIREAVLFAHIGLIERSRYIEGHATHSEYEELERHPDAWKTTPAVDALGALAANNQGYFAQTILTTNFDPLIEVSARRAGAQVFRTSITADGSVAAVASNHAADVHIIHLHGSWFGNTMHTPSQLQQQRPVLEASLRRLLQDCTLVVMAYGGWDDVVGRTLVSLFSDPQCTTELLWGFYESSKHRILYDEASRFRLLAPAISMGRAAFYCGVDAHILLPALQHQRQNQTHPRSAAGPMLANAERDVLVVIKEISSRSLDRRATLAEILLKAAFSPSLVAIDEILEALIRTGYIRAHGAGMFSITELGFNRATKS